MSIESEQAVECFQSGFNCAQAVFSSLCERYGCDKELAYKISCGFGGGMSHVNSTCGAVTGAVMLIGLKHGKYTKDDTESKEITYAKVKHFVDDFIAQHGSINCSDLIHYNLNIEEETIQAREAGVFRKICPQLVKDSTELVEKYL